MPGIYGPPPKPRLLEDVFKPVPPARPEHRAISTLRWLGTFAVLILALYVYYLFERDRPNEQLDNLMRIQQQLSRQPLPRFDIPLTPIEPLQTADIIPSSAIIPATAPAPLQSATIISPR